MATKLWAVALVFFCTFLTSLAQIFFKWGSANLEFNIYSLITNYHLIFGLCLYIAGAGLLILALRGGELTVLYPVVATSFIWVSLMSTRFLPEVESMNFLKWGGIILIFGGVSLVGLSSRNPEVPV